MKKEEIIDFINKYSPIFNGDYNEVINDVKNSIIDKIDCWSPEDLTLKDLGDIEYDLLNDPYLIYNDEIVEYYSKNRADIEELINASDIWHAMSINPRASIFEAIQCAVDYAYSNVVLTIMGEIQELYA